MRTLQRPLLLCLCAFAIACGSDDPTDDSEVGTDVIEDVADTGGDTAPDVEPDIVEDTTPDVAPDVPTGPTTPEEGICLECETNAECGPDGNLCLNFPDGGQFCGWDCTTNEEICPVGTICAAVTDDISQCVPDNFMCTDPCLGVECPADQVCDPATAECIEPLGLCEPCENNAQCGGELDLCLTFQDIDSSQSCSLNCADDPNVCPDEYTCATINAPTGPLQQCVPVIGTCTDRCEDLTCENEEDICNPRTGACNPPGEVCTPCISDVDCGGEADRCLGLTGAPCEENNDCSADEFCNDAGTCVGGFCGQDCSEDPAICEEGFACFNLNDGGAQCLPLRLACVDRCSDSDCPEGFNCDDQTGECVESQVQACNAPCDANAECGGYDDLCLAIGTGGQQCYLQCGEGRDPCPIGYDCFGGVIGGLDFCLPNSASLECADCLTTSCPEGTQCRPPFGECVDEPAGCAFDADTCAEGTLCNTFENRCEPVGIDCQFEERFFQCDFGTMSCTSATAGLEGQCEESCFSDSCPEDRPECASFHGVSGRICVSDTVGGAHTCGRLMSTLTSVGRPCTVVDDPTDPSLCFAPTNFCLEDADRNVPGFCTLECVSDEECPSGSLCGEVGGASYCVPDPCSCMLPIELGEGEVDIYGRLLESAGMSRCGISWELRERRLAYGVLGADDPYRLPSVGSVLGDPNQSVSFFADDSASANDPDAGSALAIAAAGYGVSLVEFTPPVLREGEAPLYQALIDFQIALGGVAPDTGVGDAASALPIEIQVAVAQVLDGLEDGLATARATVDLVPVELRASLYAELASTIYAGETDLSLFDPAVRAVASSEDIPAGFIRSAAAIAAAVHEFPRTFEGDLSAAVFEFESDAGLIRIAGDSNDVHVLDSPTLLHIDLGGDDEYTGPVGANSGSNFPVSLAIDLNGSDTYSYEEVADPEDASSYPSDGAGRAEPVRLGDGPVTLSDVGRQGSGRLGVGMLYDWGDGHDTFESLRYSQGFGLLGVGLLSDDGGTAEFRVEAVGQGAGLFGVGVLHAGDGAHVYEGMHGVQGFGGAHGVGILTDLGGDDVYQALEGSAAAGTVLYFNVLSNNDFNLSAAQGASMGVAPSRGVDGRAISGGLGLLSDHVGNDTYGAGAGAQGFAHWNGVGLHHDFDGDDAYAARALSGGAATEFGVGTLVNAAGNDDYGSAGTRPLNSYGYGSDFGGGVFIDYGGMDEYFTSQFSLGFGRLNGSALFVDQAGDDAYDSDSNDSLGRAVLTIFGSEPSDNPRREVGTFGFFIDAAGFDTYERPDLLSPPIGDGTEWLQTSGDEEDLPTYGGGIDEIGATGF